MHAHKYACVLQIFVYITRRLSFKNVKNLCEGYTQAKILENLHYTYRKSGMNAKKGRGQIDGNSRITYK